MTDKGGNGIGDNDASVISAKKAYSLIADELRKASSVGADAGHEAEVTKDLANTAGTTANWNDSAQYVDK